METVLNFEQALERVLEAAAAGDAVRRRSLAVEHVDLLKATGRVLAEPVAADRDQPAFDRSTRDGFALRAADLGRPLQLMGCVRAGERWQGKPLESGDAVEIMTGAPVPAGADAVLMLEHATVADGVLTAAAGRTLRAGENVVPRAAEARAGAVLLPAGRRIGAPEVAMAAQCGRARVSVHRRPRVAILATGDELVEVTERPEAWQIRNSNTAALAALVAAAGGEPKPLPIARDHLDDLRSRLSEAREADLLLISGGVSMGKYDLVETALAELAASFHFTGARIQPGKPVVFGELPAAAVGAPAMFFFGLPGNPVSTEVCFRLFCEPMLRALGGEPARGPQFAEAWLAEDVRGGAAVMRFLPATLEGDWRGTAIRLVPWQGSGDLAANSRANAFAVLPIGPDRFTAGETVRVLLR